MDKRIYQLFIAFLIVTLGLCGCQTKLEGYSNTIEMYVYGKDKLSEYEIDQIETITDTYSKYLFSIDNGIPTVKEDDLMSLAPDESFETWRQVYAANQSNSQLESFQLLDLYVADNSEVYCLCLCTAEYSDYKTPQGQYLFITRIELSKSGEQWIVTSSELLGTGDRKDMTVLRDDITNEIKMVKKGGE